MNGQREWDEACGHRLFKLAWMKRKDAKKEGIEILQWQRPDRSKIPEDAVVLDTGAVDDGNVDQ